MKTSSHVSLTSSLVRKAEEHLKRKDRLLRLIIRKVGVCTLNPPGQDPFNILVSSIIGQQLSAKAASTIRGRVVNLLGQKKAISPEALLEASPLSLREAGLSAAKTRYVQELAKAVRCGTLDLVALRHLNDESVVEILTRQPGIGRWTAEMFLIFAFGRPDVLSLADSGLRRAVRKVYGFDGRPSDDDMVRLAEKWRPFRTVASWYLWRSLEV